MDRGVAAEAEEEGRSMQGTKQVVVVIVFVRYSVFAFRECKRVCPLKLELLNSV